jgi:hypothetical protein
MLAAVLGAIHRGMDAAIDDGFAIEEAAFGRSLEPTTLERALATFVESGIQRFSDDDGRRPSATRPRTSSAADELGVLCQRELVSKDKSAVGQQPNQRPRPGHFLAAPTWAVFCRAVTHESLVTISWQTVGLLRCERRVASIKLRVAVTDGPVLICGGESGQEHVLPPETWIFTKQLVIRP